jgi:hypothetical protein
VARAINCRLGMAAVVLHQHALELFKLIILRRSVQEHLASWGSPVSCECEPRRQNRATCHTVKIDIAETLAIPLS